MAPKRRTPKKSTPVDALTHKDRRANIPTDELRGFVADDEKAAKVAKYPRWRSGRDASFDPQLVWKGKDEQDLSDLEVPTVPIYIQEKVHPRVIIENLRDTAGPGEAEPELSLFDDFNGIEFDQLVDFYQHDQNWSNRLILGDSLLVMTSLAEKERLRGKVQTIYFDPPYGVEFRSNWQATTGSTQVKDGRRGDVTREPEQIRAFRDTWHDGTHSYLGYLRDRLAVSRDLLTESGSIFVQMSDDNVHLVRCVLDEVFGAENFCGQIAFAKTTSASSKKIASVFDYLLWYARSADKVKVRSLYEERKPIENPNERYVCVETPQGEIIDLSLAQKEGKEPIPEGRILRLADPTSQDPPSAPQPFEFDGRTFHPPGKRHWSVKWPEGMEKVRLAGLFYVVGNTLVWKNYRDWNKVKPINNIWTSLKPSGFGAANTYVVQTIPEVIERCLLMTSDPGDLVLDPTCGSGTTAMVAEKHGRRWITADTSRIALALTRARLMAARYPAYVLADSAAGRKKEFELSGIDPPSTPPEGRVTHGFVYQRVPRVTLGGVAENPDIREGMRPDEVAAALARHSEQILLFDRPYEERKVVRVTGPFTVESLSPHRVDSQGPHPDASGPDRSSDSFEQTIFDNLLKAGVQNRVKQQRLKLDSIEPYAGTWIQAVGHFSDESGELRRAAISLGPEYGTVGSEQVQQAAKEAVKGAGFHLLLVCGFAFDAHAGEAAKEFKPDADHGWAVAAEERKLGKLPVLLVRMNTDLAMGDELLKQTGAGNLFMVFGEPDINVEKNGGGQIEVEVKGVDVYDPTTGEIRSDSTEGIACWFIDTNYNEESFFVRHAYFTGGNDPYKRLKASLKADIDKEAWESLYTTRSRPFDPPDTGKVAIKVINHYGDEVLKVYEVA